ncbi:hypothetical protein F1188_18920 [Roseospira marina]|uniref:Uncharacterized protein n=1 Tax=Roseospira marina TaxID=140057 RepID=A0A5M6I7Y4_9PROT|nr:hypothetical protein [Roseospira marina]KAA5603849.1 hypothetical protein F1188_18920 [Roseospira marina]MBB4313762.1 hypothetical protein [Roseospira marina]MBB5086924.1 hypothetical protein [Roseospira marina]
MDRPALPAIPVVDIGHGGAPALLKAARHQAEGLLLQARRTFTPPVLRLADRLCARWLERNNTPYADELRALQTEAGPGALALNLSHQWACTAAAAPDAPDSVGRPGGVTLLRALDWNMRGLDLGRWLVVARMRGPAGAFLSVTWPGYAGVLTGMAPGRFAVALNQAPVSGPGLLPLRWLGDRRRVWSSDAPPPDHLLRAILETAPTATDALHRLREAPVCVPYLLTLAGVDRAEAWVIEKDWTGTRIRQHPAVAANHWGADIPCHPRGGNSRGRWAAMAAAVEAGARDFTWLAPPIVWPATRLAVEANAHAGRLQVLGLDGARRVTARLALSETPSLAA